MNAIGEWFGSGTCNKRLSLIRGFWRGQGRSIVTITPERESYREAKSDEDVVARAMSAIRMQAKLPGWNLPQFMADFGTGPESYWGCRLSVASDGQHVRTEPAARTMTEALSLTPLPIADPIQNARRTVCIFDRLQAELESNEIWLRIPSIHGALGMAVTIVDQEELLVAMLEKPSEVRLFFERLTDFLIVYVQYLRSASGCRDCGMIWPYTFLPSQFGISLVEDHLPLVSPELYREFAIPYLTRLANSFGGLQIHCCGSWGPHARSFLHLGDTLRAVEFHYPFTTIEELNCLSATAVYIPYICLDQQDVFENRSQYFQFLLENTSQSHRYWFAFPEDSEEARWFAQEHGF